MSLPAALCQYFRECLLSDYRSLALLNLYSKRVEQRSFISGREEMLSGQMPWYPLTQEYGKRVVNKLKLYQREMQLYYCSLLLTGKTAAGEDVCAPLILVPLVPETYEDGVIVRLQPNQRILNMQALQLAAGIEGDTLQHLWRHWPDVLDEAGMLRLTRLLEQHLPQLNTSHLYTYPQLLSERELRNQVRQYDSQDPGLCLLPLSCMALIRMSEGVSAIETELSMLAAQQSFSAPLRAVFGKNMAQVQTMPHRPLQVESLSRAQQQALHNASSYHLSQITGPPGTGKSFTIASLAISQLALGQSVLVLAKTDTAADVVHGLIENMLPELPVSVRAGKGYQRALVAYFKYLLAGVNKFYAQQQVLDPKQWRQQYETVSQQLLVAEERLSQQLEVQLKWGKILKDAQSTGSWLVKLQKFYLSLRHQGAKPVWLLAQEVEKLVQQKEECIKKLIQAEFLQGLINLLKYKRTALANFYAALRARKSGEQQAYWQKVDFAAALEALPIWVVSLRDVGEVLPLKENLFDLVLIDEATQCDIASCLPALQRGKRAVIVGDPQQLRHLSFLSVAEQERLQQKWKLQEWPLDYLDYRRNSILDVLLLSLQSQQQVVMLNEHYRSQPDIISFSNKQFYGNSLHIMTELPHKERVSLEACQVAGRFLKGVNEVEAETIAAWIKEKVASEEALDAKLCSTIGVLSPFREQTDYLAKRISELFDATVIEKHQLRVATPYGFQGEERDIMLLSLALDASSHPSAWRHMARPDVLNVAITRARHYQRIFHSLAAKEVPQELIRTYLQQAGRSKKIHDAATALGKDLFIQEVTRSLQEQGLSCWPAYSLAGMEVEVLVKTAKGYFAIDLIGYPGLHENYYTPERYRVLARIGVRVFPMPYALWHYKQQECLTALFSFMQIRRKQQKKSTATQEAE